MTRGGLLVRQSRPVNLPPSVFSPPPNTGITSGQQLVDLFNVNQTSTISPRLDTNVGPNALLQSASYPVPANATPVGSPLLSLTIPGEGFFRIDGTNEASQILIPAWGSTTATYVNNNSSANHGGIVPGGGMNIDGFVYPAGTYVFQFLDFNGGAIDMLGGPSSVLFRGCRGRGTFGASPGWCNTSSWTGQTSWHFCDAGGRGSLNDGSNGAQYGLSASGGFNMRMYRNYISYISDGVVMNPQAAGYGDFIENFIEKICLYPGTGSEHLDGFQTNGGAPNLRILRNSVVTTALDEQNNVVNQTGCISFFQDFSPFPGTGINPDGSLGYVVQGNYVGGCGYCFYLGLNLALNPAGSVQNMNFTNNLFTTSQWPLGGANGPVTFPPPWGTLGNTQSGNIWADGPNAGQSVI